MKLEAMKRQAGRPFPNPAIHPSDRTYSADTEHGGVGQIAMRPAVELSYLPQEQQELLQNVIESESRAPTHVQAVKIRKLSDEGRLDNKTIISVMREYKPEQAKHFKLPREKIQCFFPLETPAQRIEETIIKALELWHNSQKSRPD